MQGQALRKQESRLCKAFRTPVFAGVTLSYNIGGIPAPWDVRAATVSRRERTYMFGPVCRGQVFSCQILFIIVRHSHWRIATQPLAPTAGKPFGMVSHEKASIMHQPPVRIARWTGLKATRHTSGPNPRHGCVKPFGPGFLP
jgi:hypothetical protein